MTSRRFRAPGRVNLIGDHTDYNEGFVMPMAIQLDTVVARTPHEPRELRLSSRDMPGAVTLSLERPLAPRHDWTDYVAGVAHVLLQEGRRLQGAHLDISSTVPQGAGLSSSAALEVAAAFALLDGDIPDRVTLARWCQRAENEFVGARCGIMDQYVACLARRGHALLIDCRSLESRALPVPEEAAVIVSNTMVRHSIAGGEYNERRAQCEEGVRLLQQSGRGVRSLRHLTVEDLAECERVLPPLIFRRVRHVITENARVLAAGDALARGDVVAFGALMLESHASLRDDYAVSSPELDRLVDIARQHPGALGSRMTGGGFGGSTVTLARRDAADSLVETLRDAYWRETGMRPDVLVCVPSDGAGEVS